MKEIVSKFDFIFIASSSDSRLLFTVHCWDYRRYVVEKAGVAAEREFQFCDEKIQKNFSNYSSWHYRSQLLPILHPHESDSSRPISEVKLKEELELVITAAFTDPNDSSAWFYQRWLLGYSDPKLDLAAFKITKNLAILSFSKPVDLVKDSLTLAIDSIPELNEGKWKTLSGSKSDSIWIQEGDFQLPTDDVKVTLKVDSKEFQLETKKLPNGSIIGIKCPAFGYEFGSAVMDELRNQLDSCNELLEYEPDSKWTLLTASLLMRSIDRFHYHEKTLEFLEKLQKVDNLRAGYYKDLASKWTVEIKLRNWIESEEFKSGKVDLTNLNLTTLYYHQYFAIATEVDLQGNPKLNRNSCKFSRVRGCEVLF
jgi:geranylgeranyl transferase type-2 subunit alpha